MLRETANLQKENLSSLLTWQGRGDVEDEVEIGSTHTRSEASVQFLYDRLGEASRWHWTTTRGEVNEDSEQIVDTDPIAENSLLKDSTYWRYGPMRPKTQQLPRELFVLQDSEAQNNVYGRSFIPSWYLTHFGADQARDLLFRADQADNPALTPSRVWRESSYVVLEITNNASVTRFEFDTAKGGNIVKYSYEGDPNLTVRVQRGWRQVNGVWIPDSIDIVNTQTLSSGQKRVLKRSVVWSDIKVNEPIPEEEFSVDRLGVQPGDIVHDARASIRYTYQEIPDPSEVLAQPTFDSSIESPMPELESASPPMALGQEQRVNLPRTREIQLESDRGTIFLPWIIGGTLAAASFVVVAIVWRRRLRED